MNYAVALMAFNYHRGKWECLNIDLGGNQFITAERFTKSLTDHGREVYTAAIDLRVKSFTVEDNKYSIVPDDEGDWPEVVSLEESIQNTIKVLSNYQFQFLKAS